jgi:hypothetical protein
MYCWSVVALEKWSGIGIRVDLVRTRVLGSPGRWLLSQSFGDEEKKQPPRGYGWRLCDGCDGLCEQNRWLRSYNLLESVDILGSVDGAKRAVTRRLCSSNRKKGRNSTMVRAKA